jgi:glucose/arabinose dehydrogenase
MRQWVLALLLALGCSGAARATTPYVPNGDCAGFPRLGLQSMPGSCVGLVAAHLGFVRGVAVLGHDVYVVDMGGWVPGKGRLLRLSQDGHGAPQVLLSGLDEPNAVAVAPDGGLYIGELGRIVHVDVAPSPPVLRDVFTGLPNTGRHPLPAFVLAGDGSLYINVGSATDNCKTPGAEAAPVPCPDTSGPLPRAAIYHVMPRADAVLRWQDAQPVAFGLRNSMGLAILPGGQLVAAVNARDFINQANPQLSDEDLPHDTLDVIRNGADYGWPYCYDDNVAAPEYPHSDCAAKQKPDMLLPPHSAPLGLLVYQGTALPALHGMLLVPLHGYRKQGHTLMALRITPQGVAGPLVQVIWGWDAAPGIHPQGNPVALAELPDGSVLITEDHNGTLLRLAPD